MHEHLFPELVAVESTSEVINASSDVATIDQAKSNLIQLGHPRRCRSVHHHLLNSCPFPSRAATLAAPASIPGRGPIETGFTPGLGVPASGAVTRQFRPILNDPVVPASGLVTRHHPVVPASGVVTSEFPAKLPGKFTGPTDRSEQNLYLRNEGQWSEEWGPLPIECIAFAEISAPISEFAIPWGIFHRGISSSSCRPGFCRRLRMVFGRTDRSPPTAKSP